MCLQKHKLTPDSKNRAGRAAKLLRSTVSTWLVTRCPAWLGLFPDFSLYSVLTLKPTLMLAWRDVGEAKQHQTATFTVRDGVAGSQASAASYQGVLSHTDREGVADGSRAEGERLRDIQFPPQQPPAGPASLDTA